MSLFQRLERLVPATGEPPGPPPTGLIAFYWHFVKQAKGLFLLLMLAGLAVALLDASIPYFIGQVVRLVSQVNAQTLVDEHWPLLLTMALVILIGRPIAIFSRSLLANQAIAAGFSNLIRWQSHWHVVRQSWAFFQNDFAGRIANKVMQTGPALRESVVASIDAVWYILVYGTSALILLSQADLLLCLPIFIWTIAYMGLLIGFVPKMQKRSLIMSEARSMLTGRIVDSYTNILTLKLFARARDEDAYVADAVQHHTGEFLVQLRLTTRFVFLLTSLNALLVVSTGALAIKLNLDGKIDVGQLAMALPMTWQIVSMSGWVAFQVTAIFENIGVVQEGLGTLAREHELIDKPGAKPLVVDKGAIEFKNVTFAYGRQRGVIQGLSLKVKPGEKIGLVGPSGAGKSTLVNLLLRFFELEDGRIEIDGQDIAAATQESLRAAIAVVTQDTSLLHRSIRDNIRYGRPEAGEAEILDAATRARATDFIDNLEDWRGRHGFDSHVGERGVKLSGGQRQRIAIARVILKNAPILVLDEATSALDSEAEAAIQASLDTLMEGKTVIAIAHRLSTIARMDRLVVLDHGRIVEEGSHQDLLAKDGLYARLWRRQSGGFLDESEGA